MNSTWPNRAAELTVEPARRDYLIRKVFLNASGGEYAVRVAQQMYQDGKIEVEELETLLDAIILGQGLDAIVRCPRCGAAVRGFASADGGMTAVRCSTPECHFVGYVDG